MSTRLRGEPNRRVPIERVTKETQITGELNIDGSGISKIKTPIGLLSHMLELFTFHGFFDLTLEVKGDTHIDIHHTNEDIGIALGKAFKQTLGEKAGIRRFGSGFAPMEDTLGHTVIDISGRGHWKLDVSGYSLETLSEVKSEEGYTLQYLKHFVESFSKQLGATVIILVKRTEETDLHSIMEAVFKSLALALDQATQIDPRRKGVPSTKGIID